MIFTIRDVEILRVLRWCRYADPSDLIRCTDKAAVENLVLLKLIKRHRPKGFVSLTAKGNALVVRTTQDLPEHIQLPYRSPNVERQVRSSRVYLTAYSAEVPVFTKNLSALAEKDGHYLASFMRGKGANPWSNSRIATLLRLGDTLYAAHYVCPGIGELLLTDELNAFNNNTSQIKNVRRAFFFAGQSYMDVLAELCAAPANEPGRYVSYAYAYRQLSLPVHLLSCDTTGSMQLRLMAMPDYRQVLTRSALQTKYAEAPPEIPSWDAMFDGKPFVMAADMDLRRIDAAVKAAKERGIAQIVMVALKPQVEAVLKSRYRETGLARVFSLKEEMLSDLGINKLYTPPLEGFRTEKGEVIDAPLIQAARKAGGSSGK